MIRNIPLDGSSHDFASEACISTCSPGAFRDQNLTQTEGLSVQVEVMEGKWEAWEGWNWNFNEVVRYVWYRIHIFTSYLHILEIYTLSYFCLLVLSWFGDIWCMLMMRVGAWGWRGWSLGTPLTKKFQKTGAAGEKSIPSDAFLYSTCSFLVNILYTTVPWFLCYSAIDSKNKSFLNPFWFLYTGFIVLAIIQEKCPPARLAWIFVCSGCRNLIPRDQFLSVSSQSQSNIN